MARPVSGAPGDDGPRVLVVDRARPKATPRLSASARSHPRRRPRRATSPSAGSSTRRVRPRIRKRAPHRCDRCREPRGLNPRARPQGRRPVRARVPVHALRWDRMPFGLLMTGGAAILVEAFDPVPTVEVLRRNGLTLGGAGTAFWPRTWRCSARSPGRRSFPACAPSSGAGRRSRRRCTPRSRPSSAASVSHPATGSPSARASRSGSVRDPDTKLAVTDGQRRPGRPDPDRRRRRPGSCPWATSARCACAAPQLFLGYVDESLDADAFDAAGLCHPGDLGRLDADGYLVISGRLKDIIIRKGENISAKQVEDILYAHQIADVAVARRPGSRARRTCVRRRGAGGRRRGSDARRDRGRAPASRDSPPTGSPSASSS